MTTAAESFMAFDAAPPGLCEHVGPGIACRMEAQDLWPLVRRMCRIHALRFLDPAFRGCGCGPEPCEHCARYVASGRRVIVVGERENGARSPVPDAEVINKLHAHFEFHRGPGYLIAQEHADAALAQFHRRRRAFSWGASRQRLIGIGLRWNLAVNLLGSSPKVGEWDAAAARDAAWALKPFLGGWDVVLTGKRVHAAFDCVLASGPSALLLPHPSGRNREWNDPATAERCRQDVACLHSRRS